MVTTTAVESHPMVARRPLFAQIRWGAIFAGLVSGLGTYMLLMLLGFAVGVTVYQPPVTDAAETVPVATGIWTGISMLISAFVGGYVAARSSGLGRLTDGILHGLVAWGATTVLFAYLTTTAVGSVLGGTFSVASQAIQGLVQGGTTGQSQVQTIIGGGEANVSPEALSALQDRLSAQDRSGAVQVMVQQMGISPDRANQIVDQFMPLFGPQGQQTAENAMEAVSAASWWLFAGLLLSLALSVWGGSLGSRATSHRNTGEYTEREREIELHEH